MTTCLNSISALRMQAHQSSVERGVLFLGLEQAIPGNHAGSAGSGPSVSLASWATLAS